MGCIVLTVVGNARAYSGASSRYFGKNSSKEGGRPAPFVCAMHVDCVTHRSLTHLYCERNMATTSLVRLPMAQNSNTTLKYQFSASRLPTNSYFQH